MPAVDTTSIRRPQTRLLLVERMPNSTPTIVNTTSAPTISERLTPSRPLSVRTTESPVMYEVPRSPWKKPASQSR